MTFKEFKQNYRNEWRRAYAAFGGFEGANGWIMDLIMAFDVQWNTQTGEVGPLRLFITELNPWMREAAEFREIPSVPGASVGTMFDVLRCSGLGKIYGDLPCRVLNEHAHGKRLLVRQGGREIVFAKLADPPRRELEKGMEYRKDRMKFIYHDNPYRTRLEKITKADLAPSRIPDLDENAAA
jgi:hypothetical protein